MHHSTSRIAHTTACVTPVVEHWLEREIAQWVHPMKDRSDDPSHHERTLLPRSYISLLSIVQCVCVCVCVGGGGGGGDIHCLLSDGGMVFFSDLPSEPTCPGLHATREKHVVSAGVTTVLKQQPAVTTTSYAAVVRTSQRPGVNPCRKLVTYLLHVVCVLEEVREEIGPTLRSRKNAPSLSRWHWTKSSDCQVRVRGAPSNLYGMNVRKAVISAYMWQWWLVQILWHLPCVFSSFCCLINYYTVTFATCWYMGWVKILQLTFCVNLTVATVNFL